jgi:hypothetical protein
MSALRLHVLASGGPTCGVVDAVVLVSLTRRHPAARMHTLAVALLQPAAQPNSRCAPIFDIATWTLLVAAQLLDLADQLGQYRRPRTTLRLGGGSPRELAYRNRDLQDPTATRVTPRPLTGFSIRPSPQQATS